MSHIQVYALGGTGAVFAAPLYKMLSTIAADPQQPKIKVAFIDAGTSSYEGISTNDHYVIKKFDDQGRLVQTKGSGQLRSENYEAAVSSIGEIMYKFPPGDINIVIHSAGGGTGSAVAMPIVKHLLAQKQITLVVTPVSTNTLRLAQNCRDTLQSYINICDEEAFPLAIRTFFNTEDGFGKNEKEFVQTVYGLSGLFAQDLKHLDPADVRSFFDYTKLLRTEPQVLTFMGPNANGEINIGNGYAVTALSLFRDKKNWLPECTLRNTAKNIITPSFHKTGHYDVEVNTAEAKDAHFVMVDGLLNDTMVKLSEAIDSIQRAQSAVMVPRVKPKSTGGSSVVFS